MPSNDATIDSATSRPSLKAAADPTAAQPTAVQPR
eukprot:CAMPEP_0174839102 /NCGR_PEP_ID=MMETSP1114-20130205/7830_1 /TAXON_ID=312471 /ORGANISM="Neobodo designis, Strain CCAP 1951/1" /LENGTH=34 /DNA_ID= /DNA_START= /DNA_END= /DNA_ORIENTATION=